MKSLICAIILISQCWLIVQAGCFTGAACSIDDLQKKEYSIAIEKYFNKNILEPNFVRKDSPVVVYNDLFLFNTIV